MAKKLRVYLAGSFYAFRDEIIKSLPEYSFSDPRTHRQSSIAKLVMDDMTEAEKCPVLYAYFPKGKARGVMTYAEIGCSVAKGNHLIVVDENEQKDSLLESLANHHFTDFKESLEFLKKGITPVNRKNKKKAESQLCSKVYFCGSTDYGLQRVVELAKKLDVKKEFVLKSDPSEDFKKIKEYDLVVVHFPAHVERDRHACFFMGAAWYHDIPVLLLDENKPWKYPPLQGLARRHSGDLTGVLDYLVEVENLGINEEALKMYDFFKTYKT